MNIKTDIFQAMQIIIIVLIATFILYCVDQQQWGLLTLVMLPALFMYSTYKALYYFCTNTGRQQRVANSRQNKTNKIKQDYK